MDKWKDVELAKMKVGGNRKAKQFFESRPDYQSNWNIHHKYNSKTAALYRDKVLPSSKTLSMIEYALQKTFLRLLLNLVEKVGLKKPRQRAISSQLSVQARHR